MNVVEFVYYKKFGPHFKLYTFLSHWQIIYLFLEINTVKSLNDLPMQQKLGISNLDLVKMTRKGFL